MYKKKSHIAMMESGLRRGTKLQAISLHIHLWIPSKISRYISDAPAHSYVQYTDDSYTCNVGR